MTVYILLQSQDEKLVTFGPLEAGLDCLQIIGITYSIGNRLKNDLRDTVVMTEMERKETL